MSITIAAGALTATAGGVKVLTERALDPNHPEKIGEDIQQGLIKGTGVQEELDKIKPLIFKIFP